MSVIFISFKVSLEKTDSVVDQKSRLKLGKQFLKDSNPIQKYKKIIQILGFKITIFSITGVKLKIIQIQSSTVGDSIIHVLSLFLYVTSLGLRVSLKAADVSGFKTIGISSTFLYQQSMTSSQLTRA